MSNYINKMSTIGGYTKKRFLVFHGNIYNPNSIFDNYVTSAESIEEALGVIPKLISSGIYSDDDYEHWCYHIAQVVDVEEGKILHIDKESYKDILTKG